MRESEELVERAAALRPVLEARQAEGDRERRLTDEAVAAVADAGIFRMFVPEAFGGAECGLRTAIDVTAALAAGDPSASWVVMVLGVGDWLAGQLPDEVRREIYADGPDTLVCTTLTPRAKTQRVEDGWLISGEWFPASGCCYAKWALVGFPITETEAGIALVPMSELRIKDTWFTLGMRGTGSNTLIGQDVFVPDRRVLRLGDVIGNDSHASIPRHRSASLPTIVTYMIGPYLGIASAALDQVVAQAGGKPISFTTFARQSDSTAF